MRKYLLILTMTSMGTEHLVIRLKENMLNQRSGYWIEGIGGNAGIEHPCMWSLRGYYYEFLSVYDDDECVFRAQDLWNHVSSVTPMVIKGSQDSSPVFDLQGRRVANPQKGIYIRNGKKMVVK